jgi:hypothetical protein
MNKNEIIERALQECESLMKQHPTCSPLEYVAVQLRYLKGLLAGEHSDKSRLKDINVGLIAVREFSTRFPDFTEQLFAVAKVVDDMRYGR